MSPTKEKQASTRRVLSFLFQLWHVAPVLTSALMFTQIIFAVLTTAIAPLFVSQLLGEIANGTATLHNSIPLLTGYFLILIVGDVIAIRCSIFLSFKAVTAMQAHVYRNVISSLMEKSMSFHANRMSGGIVNNASKLHGSIERFWDTIAYNGIPIVATVTSVCIALTFIFWQYALVLFILSILVAFIITRGQNFIAPRSKVTSEKGSAVVAYFADTVGNINTVKAFSGEAYEQKQFEKVLKPWKSALMRERNSVVMTTASFGLVLTFMNMAAIIAAVYATELNIASVSTTYLVIVYTLNVVAQLWNINGLTRTYIRLMGDAAPMIDTLDSEAEIKNPVNPQKSHISKGSISFKNISFTHDNNSDALFTHFNLEIPAGQKVGLVGHSGSGKTSLTRLLLRFSDLKSGAITIDDQDITAITQQDLRKSMSYVAQEPTMFHRTLEDNIRYGNPSAKRSAVIDAAKKAHAVEFIETLPEKFETLVGERGVKLSGGQRQRVAIARAILKDAPILVLDEATSALDSESEKLIQDALEKLMQGRTSIVIAHRLSTIAKLDRIIVLDNGKIVEDGSHSELLKRKGVYAKLWSHQSGGFIEE